MGRKDPKDLARDNSGTRSFSTFLVEVAEKVPSVMLTNISVLMCHLEGEVSIAIVFHVSGRGSREGAICDADQH